MIQKEGNQELWNFVKIAINGQQPFICLQRLMVKAVKLAYVNIATKN
ncbi:MAG: hypothetical protein LKG31_00665 [Lactobacillus sp.]|nr:hypothetical protein [Lactobacillus sp.]